MCVWTKRAAGENLRDINQHLLNNIGVNSSCFIQHEQEFAGRAMIFADSTSLAQIASIHDRPTSCTRRWMPSPFLFAHEFLEMSGRCQFWAFSLEICSEVAIFERQRCLCVLIASCCNGKSFEIFSLWKQEVGFYPYIRITRIFDRSRLTACRNSKRIYLRNGRWWFGRISEKPETKTKLKGDVSFEKNSFRKKAYG
jgi:hypothetical protein